MPLRITGWLFVLFLSGCGWGSTGGSTKSAEQTMEFPKTRLLAITIRDAQRSDIDDYRGQVIPLVRLLSGDLVVPAVEVKRPKKGFMDRVVYVNQRQEPLLGVGKGSVLGLPVGPNVGTYLLLVKGLSSDTGWRVFEINPEKLGKGDPATVTIANISGLPRLDERADAKEIWRQYERAANEARQGEDKKN